MQAFNILKFLLNAAEVLACLGGFIYWRKIKNTYYKWFPVYLAIIVVAELTGNYLTSKNLNSIKVGMYNYFVIPLEILFFTYLFLQEFKNTKVSFLPVAAIVIYIVCWIIDILILMGKDFWFSSFSYTVGIILLLVQILLFLYKLAKSNEVLFVKTNLMFWICLGLLVFYLCSLPFFGLGNILLEKYRDIYITYAYTTYVFNCIMYTMFIIGFIWAKPRLSYS